MSFGFKPLDYGQSGSLVRIGDFALELNDSKIDMMIDGSYVDSIELLHESLFHLFVIRNHNGQVLVEVSRDSIENVNGENDFDMMIADYEVNLRFLFLNIFVHFNSKMN